MVIIIAYEKKYYKNAVLEREEPIPENRRGFFAPNLNRVYIVALPKNVEERS